MAREERSQKGISNAQHAMCLLIRRWRDCEAKILRQQKKLIEQKRREAKKLIAQKRRAARLEWQARRLAQEEWKARWKQMNRKDITMEELLRK
eukprot:TRINITY_DN9431_c0_g1_i4.p1 TRINITY_DN9431_c0_g1~~TRINITY_DN9431_c0_g1_i4.p1  ORF type:complete len:103 (-),score=23.67 TRINITY_DN9431_c0_g1_i4:220-498(-)